jgi:recombination protein RecA
MFGCFDHSTGVTLADGTQEKIGEIVDQRLPAEVLSYDAERDEVVPRTVTNWFDNGPTDGFLRFTVAKPSEGESGQFACTPNHLIRTPGGWREAAELCEGDRVLQTVTTYLSDEQWEVVLGSLMGGGTLSRDDGRAARLRFEHGVGEIAYAEWKASLLSNISVDRRVDARGAVQHETQPLAELEGLRRSVFLADRMVLSDEHLKQLTPRALAICYMDSGDLADGPADQAEIEVERLAPGSRERLRQHLRDAWGLTGELTTKAATAVLRFSHEATPKLENLIAAHVHPSMEHKLSPAHRERFADQTLVGEPAERLMALPITSVAWEPAAEGSHRYDLEVDGTHNYFVDGVMVHNSPETTPGGRALKFYSSVRLDVRRIESLKDGNDAIGNRVRVKVVKNKVAPPFRQAEFDLMYGTGISKEGALLDLGVDHGVVKKAGAWYTYEGEQLGQGRENAKKFLAEHDDVAQAITKQLHEQLGLVPTDIAGEEATETGGPAEAAEDGAGGEATKGSNGNKGAKGGNGSKSSGGAKPAEPAGAGSAEAGDGDG